MKTELLMLGVLLVSMLVGELICIYLQRPKPNPKACPKCKCTEFSLMRSTCVKMCTNCGYEKDWQLDEGQLPLIRSNRMVKREKTN